MNTSLSQGALEDARPSERVRQQPCETKRKNERAKHSGLTMSLEYVIVVSFEVMVVNRDSSMD